MRSRTLSWKAYRLSWVTPSPSSVLLGFASPPSVSILYHTLRHLSSGFLKKLKNFFAWVWWYVGSSLPNLVRARAKEWPSPFHFELPKIVLFFLFFFVLFLFFGFRNLPELFLWVKNLACKSVQ